MRIPSLLAALLLVGCGDEPTGTGVEVGAKASTATSCQVRGAAGDLIFETDLGGVIAGAPAFAGGTAFIGQHEGGTNFFAIGDDGRVLQRANIAYSVESAPAVSPDGTTVYANTINMNGLDIPADTLSDGVTSVWDGVGIQALDANSLELVGAYGGSGNPGADGSPAVSADGRSVYSGSVEGPDVFPMSFRAITGPSMDLKWEYEPPGWTYSSPVLDTRGNVYVGSEEEGSHLTAGYLYSLTSTGRLRWSLPTEGSLDGGPSIYVKGGRTYLLARSSRGMLMKVSERGSVIWELDLHTAGWGTPVLGANNGTVYVTTTYSIEASDTTDVMQVIAVSERTGEILWGFPVANLAGSTPVVGDRAVYVVDEDGTVFAIDRSTGAELWSTPTGHPSYAGYAGLNECGALQFGSSDGTYVSVQTESRGMESTSDCPTYRCDYGRTGNAF